MTKKHIIVLSMIAGFSLLMAGGNAAAPHSRETAHTHETLRGGPNGGRVLHAVTPHVEVYVRSDRRLQLTVLDDGLQPAALGTLSAAAVTGDRKSPVALKFERAGEALLSDAPLPPGNNLPLILTLQSAPDSPPVRERLTLNLAFCGGCKLQEYACTCNH